MFPTAPANVRPAGGSVVTQASSHDTNSCTPKEMRRAWFGRITATLMRSSSGHSRRWRLPLDPSLGGTGQRSPMTAHGVAGGGAEPHPVDLVLNAQHPHGNVLSKINDGRWDPLVRDMAALDESDTGALPPLTRYHAT
jgi:hypothetical protein